MTNFIFLPSLFLSHENPYLQSIPFCLRVILSDLDKYSFITWCSHFYSPFVSCLMKSFDAMNFPIITSSVVVQSPSPTLCNPMDCSTPRLPVPHHLPKFAQVHVHYFGDAIQPSHPLTPSFLLPSIFPSIKDFSNELSVCIRWPNYWSFNFSISPSSRYSGLISHKIDWFDPLAIQRTFRRLLQHLSPIGFPI